MRLKVRVARPENVVKWVLLDDAMSGINDFRPITPRSLPNSAPIEPWDLGLPLTLVDFPVWKVLTILTLFFFFGTRLVREPNNDGALLLSWRPFRSNQGLEASPTSAHISSPPPQISRSPRALRVVERKPPGSGID